MYIVLSADNCAKERTLVDPTIAIITMITLLDNVTMTVRKQQ